MNYRLSTIMESKNYSADGTEIIDLDLVDPFSALLVELDVLGVGDIPTAHAIACLTKIEIVDGSDVLFSLNGYEAEAVDIYHHKEMRSNWNPYLDTLSVQRFIGINFGRYLWDTELAFDPKKFRNPQLKLSLNINAGGNAPIQNTLKVWGAMFDQKAVTPIGFLMHKEIKDYVATASAHEYTDLPRDYPYRKLFIRQMEHGAEPCQNLANFKLSEDQDKRVILNHATEDLMRMIASQNPQLIEQIMFAANTDTREVFTTVTERATATFTGWRSTLGTGTFASLGSAGGRMIVDSGGNENAVAIVAGWLPHGVWEIPFGLQDQIDDWFDVAKTGSLKLDILGGAGLAGTETVQIFLQQLRKYAAAA